MKLTRHTMLPRLAGFGVLCCVSALPTLTQADHDTVQRLEHEAQVQSNNGHYSEARDLRAIAEALRQNKDSVVSRQVTSELQRHDLGKAKELLRVR